MWIPDKIKLLLITPFQILEVIVYGFFGTVIAEGVKLGLDWLKEKVKKK